MKRLLIVRHAKSSWDNPDLEDFFRPLNNRGFRDSPNMADYIKNKGLEIQLFISSPAVRALSTAQIFASKIGYSIDKIQQEMSFYEFLDEGEIILSKIREIDNNLDTVAIFGHNDTFLYLIQSLSNGKIDTFPTCAVANVVFNVKNWSEVSSKKCKVDFFVTPKSIK